MGNPAKIRCVVSALSDHGGGVFTVEFTADRRIPRYKAGQFLHLTVDRFDPQGGHWPESRVFSIASEPGEPVVRIVYSVKGRYTTRMSQELAVGREVWLKFPYGDFIVEKLTPFGSDVVLIAGGTGIAPFIPYLAARKPGQRVHLAYGARSADALLFAERIASSIDDAFSADFYLENAGDSGYLPVAVQLGMVPIDEVWERTRNLQSPCYFLSGPPGMIFVFRSRLAEWGVPPERIRIDEWE